MISAPTDAHPDDFIWDESTQQLTILQWPQDRANLTLKIVPGIAAAN